MGTPIVLFVDDEPNILNALRRLFMDEEYDIHTAGNGRQALALMEDGLRPTIIISDQRMPEMGGAEFLAQAAQLAPDSIRMVLTGYADINAAVAAINLGGIYRYILKPWNDDDLKLTVHEALGHFRLVEENRRLATELEDKNRDLSRMNEQLEQIVQARTQELHQKVKELEGRDAIQQCLLQVHPLSELLDTVLTVVVNVCGLDGAAYFTLGADGAIEQIATHEAGGNQAPALWDKALAAQIQSQFQLNPDVDQEGAGRSPAQALSSGGAAYALAPVATGAKFFGVLAARRPKEQAFAEPDLAALGSFAMQAAIGINDCHVHDHYDEIQTSLDDVLSGLTTS